MERVRPPMNPAVAAFRWVAVLPGAILGSVLCSVVAYGIAWLGGSIIPSRMDLIWMTVATSAASGWGFVAAGTWIAPTYRTFVPAFLAGMAVLIALLSIFVKDSDWVVWARALISSASALSTAIYIHREGGFG